MTQQQIDKIISNVKATLALSDRIPSETVIKNAVKHLKGEMTSQEVIDEITERILRKKESYE